MNFDKIFNLAVLLLIGGFLGGRLFWWLEHIKEVKSIWGFFNISGGGLSSLGGFLFAGIILFLWSRFFCHSSSPVIARLDRAIQKNDIVDSRVKPENDNARRASFWRYADILAISFIPLWIFARFGCFLIHDHPGRLSDFFLAINFPNGARFDMAFLEILLIILIGISFLIIRPKRIGGHALRLLLLYSFGRFFLDFLRATDLPISDPRYFGLTLAQYGMIILFITSAILYKKSYKF